MNKILSRRDFLKLAGVTSVGLTLSACGVDVNQLSTPTSVAASFPSLTPIPLPTQTAVATPVFYEKAKDVLNGLLQEGFANGSLGKEFNIEESQLQTKRNKVRNTDVVFARDTQTGEIMLAGYMENGEINWKIAGLKDLVETFEIKLGSMTEGVINDNIPVQEVVKQDFSFIVPSGTFYNKYWNEYGPKWAFETARSLKTGLRIQQVYYPQDDTTEALEKISTPDESRAYLRKRSKEILELIYKNRDVKSVYVVLWNEPWWEVRGKWGWMENNLTKNLGGTKEAIIESYVEFYNQATEKGFTLGLDFNIIGINVPGLEKDSEYARYMLSEIASIKEQIAQKLASETDSINFDVGIQFHLGATQGTRDKTLAIPMNVADLQAHLQSVYEAVGSKIHLTEVDIIADENQSGESYAQLLRAVVYSKVVESVSFWSTFNSGGDWQNPLLKYEGTTFLRSAVYRQLKKALTRLVDENE
jgi:hypothetical protein